MRITSSVSFETILRRFDTSTNASNSSAIVQIDNATFYRQYPSLNGLDGCKNPPMFPGLKWSLPSNQPSQQHWAVVGPSNAGKTTFLEILLGRHISVPPNGRSFPFLSPPLVEVNNNPVRSLTRAIQYVGFNGQGTSHKSSSTRGDYMSARYESRREETDISVLNYLKGNTELNPSQRLGEESMDQGHIDKVIEDLRLARLIHMPIGYLSTGQTRRARIAKALLGKPDLLLLDEPFMGLDPPTLITLSPLLHGLAEKNAPRLLLALRSQDPIPDWITHIIYLGPSLRVANQGRTDDVMNRMKSETNNDRTGHAIQISHEFGRKLTTRGIEDECTSSRKISEQKAQMPKPIKAEKGGLPDGREPLVEMENIRVVYGDKQVLGGWVQDVNDQPRQGLWWTVRRGQRWGVFGPNGSGKTTIISLICSDHPQAYSLPIKMFGRGRLPRAGLPGISIFDIQERIGQSSPEIHAFFPKNLTLRRTIENAWAETFLGTPKLTYKRDMMVDAVLHWFEPELNPMTKVALQGEAPRTPESYEEQDLDWADGLRFRDLPFTSQRVALFLRAIVKKPDLVVLDEAFSGMDEYVRDKCILFLTWGHTRYYRYYTRDKVPLVNRQLTATEPQFLGDVFMDGLTDDQALICVSHVKEEVPGVVREWICLPEANESKPARFGRCNGPFNDDSKTWNEIWGM